MNRDLATALRYVIGTAKELESSGKGKVMDRLNIGRISSKKMDMLQDLSVDFSQLVKKYIKNLKKLSSKDQKHLVSCLVISKMG